MEGMVRLVFAWLELLREREREGECGREDGGELTGTRERGGVGLLAVGGGSNLNVSRIVIELGEVESRV